MSKLLLLSLVISVLSACQVQNATKNVSGGSFMPADTTKTASPAPLAQGTINGGGGVGVRCGQDLQMLDLYEAKKAGLTISENPKTETAAIDLVAQLFAHHFWNPDSIPEDQFSEIFKKMMIVPIFKHQPIFNAETKKYETVNFVDQLELSNDYGHYQLPADCHLEQIAFFSDENTQLSIVKKAWDQLDWISKSMLVTHELIYLVIRRDGLTHLKLNAQVQTSQSTRKFVGQLFSKQSLPTKIDGMPGKDQLYLCMQGEKKQKQETYAYVFTNPINGKLSFIFNLIFGANDVYQIRADFQTAKLEDLVNDGTIKDRAPLQLFGSHQDTQLSIEVEKDSGQSPRLKLFFTDGSNTTQVNSAQTLSCRTYTRH